jgi:hypothetical protein
MHRQSGVSTVGAVLLAGLAATLATLLMMDWMFVDVQTPEPESIHIMVPFPLLAGRVAAGIVPDDVFRDAEMPPEVLQQREVVLTALRELADTPDATLVRVDADDAIVNISKTGDDLLVSVDADDTTVRCKIPVDGILDALEGWDWQTADPDLIFDILGSASMGEFVTVEAEDGTRVAIKMW